MVTVSSDDTITVRPALAEDASDVLRLLDQLIATAEDAEKSGLRGRALNALLSGDRGAVLVAEENGRIIGTISLSFNLAIRYGGEYAQIEELIVSEQGRGKQVGARLVNAAIQAAQIRGCAEIGLYSREHTRGFYERLGFRYVGPELRQSLRLS